MKLGRLRTIRGTIEVVGGVGKTNLVVADGLINVGLKVQRFHLWPDNIGALSFIGILALDALPGGVLMDAGDNRQIGWTFGKNTSIISPQRTILDPDHIVNRDLFLRMEGTTDGTYNYMIECQVVGLTDDEAIITIIKETSQS